MRDLCGMLSIWIEAKTPLYVGTGGYELDNNGIYLPFTCRGDQLIIPGSTIKGVVRSYAEALSFSCEGGKCKGENLCQCCSLFGSKNFSGRLLFTDTEPVDPKTVNLKIYNITPRWGGKNKDYGGRRFYPHSYQYPNRSVEEKWLARDGERIEAVKQDTKFKFDLHFHNLSESELGLLILGMGMADGYEFELKMGGAKNRGLGSVKLSPADKVKLKKYKNLYTSFKPNYEEKDIKKWSKTLVDSYLNEVEESAKNIIIELVKIFEGPV